MSNCRHRQVCLFLYLAKRLEKTVFGLLASKTLISALFSTLGYPWWKNNDCGFHTIIWHGKVKESWRQRLTHKIDDYHVHMRQSDLLVLCLLLPLPPPLLEAGLSQWHTPWPAAVASREQEARWAAAGAPLWEPFSCCFTHALFAMAAQGGCIPGFFGRRHDAGVGRRWDRWPGFSKSVKARHIFLRKSPSHIRKTLAGAASLISLCRLWGLVASSSSSNTFHLFGVLVHGLAVLGCHAGLLGRPPFGISWGLLQRRVTTFKLDVV